MFFIIKPVFALAAETVDISFAVQAIQIQDIIKSQLSEKAKWSLVAANLDTGKKMISGEESGSESLVPGSLMKLFVTAAVLEQNAHKPIDFDTIISFSGKVADGILNGDVIIKGGADPFLSSKDLIPALEKMHSAGIKKINGNVIIDDSLFSVKGWKGNYHGAAYGVPSAFGLDLHTVAITADGAKRSIAIDPPNDAVKVIYKKSGKPGIRQASDFTYEVSGAVPQAAIVRSRFSLKAPSLYAGGAFVTLLKREGITISGKVRRGVLPAGSQEIVRVKSSDLISYIRATNQQSLNVAAENLLFLLGAERFGAPGTRVKGLQALTDFLHQLGVSLSGMVIDDGSGTSEKNRVSSDQMVAFLQAAAKKSWFTAFQESLARPGIDGRLRDLTYKSERIRAKSGQLREAFCLAGYVDRLDGRKIAFSYMVNGNGLDLLMASSTANEVLRHLEGK